MHLEMFVNCIITGVVMSLIFHQVVLHLHRISLAVTSVIDAKEKIEKANIFDKGKH